MNENAFKLGTNITVSASGKWVAPEITINDHDSETALKGDAKSYLVAAMGYVSLWNTDTNAEVSVSDPRILALYARFLLDFARWFKDGGGPEDLEPSYEGALELQSAEDAAETCRSLGIPTEPKAFTSEAFDALSQKLGLPAGEGVNGWYKAVDAAQKLIESTKGPLIELCDGRYVRSADLTEEDKNLIADPHDSPHNAAVLGGDSYRDGKWVFQDRPPEEA